MRKLRKNSKVRVKDVVQYRFTNGELHIGEEGIIVEVNKHRLMAYVEFPNKDIGWYDLEELERV